MKGAIAAGHPLTAEAGARMLGRGRERRRCLRRSRIRRLGRREPAHRPRRGRLRARPARRRAAAPDRGLLRRDAGARPAGGPRRRDARDRRRLRRRQRDDPGLPDRRRPPAPCPGAAAGLAAVHEAYGRLPWAELLQPAIELAREGVELTRPQAHLHAILDLILRHAPEGQRLYSRADGSRLQPGDVLRLPDLGETLSRIAAEGADVLYRGDLARETASDRRRRRREADGGRSRCLPGRLAPAGSRLVSRARGDLEPAAVVGRHPDRVRARAARARPRRRAGNRGGARLARRGDARADARTRRAVRDAAASRRARAAAARRRAARGGSPRGSRRRCRDVRSTRPQAARRTSPRSTARETPRRSPRRPARAPA